MGAVWFAAASFAVVLVLLLIFILQNSRKVQISYLGAHGHLPLGVALLFAAVLGILLVVIPGTARIIQPRILARRRRAIDAGRGGSTQEPPGRLYPRAASPPASNGSSPAVTRSRLPSYMEIW
jgi:lipopolysaccharide assembly protein A